MVNNLKNLLKRKIKQDTFLWKVLVALYSFAKKCTPEQIVNYSLIKHLAFKKWLKTKNDILFFKYFYKESKVKIKIILADFAGYPLYREKRISGDIIRCGIGNLFENMTKFKAGLEFGVILVINLVNNIETEQKQVIYYSLQKNYPFIEKIIFRDNTGFDFGAYNRGYQFLRSIDYKGDILFMNSSVRGPYNDYWLLKYSYLFHRKENIGLCGISLNSHTTHLKSLIFKPHVQSFFIYTSMKVLTKVFNNSLPGADVTSDIQLDIISKGEIELSQKILENGYGICSKLFEDFIYYKGSAWKIPLGDMRVNKIYHQFANKI